MPYTCLRLPDVIGPYDCTDRFWCCVHWLANADKYPIPITTYDETEPLSFVYSLDVARLLVSILEGIIPRSKAYNLCFATTITIIGLMKLIVKAIV